MPLFICSACGSVDNTAPTDYWTRVTVRHEPPLCSACGPAGEWHGLFPREPWDGHQHVLNPPSSDG